MNAERLDRFVLAIAQGWYAVSAGRVDSLNVSSEMTPRDVPVMVQVQIVQHALSLMALTDEAFLDPDAFRDDPSEVGERIVLPSMLQEVLTGAQLAEGGKR